MIPTLTASRPTRGRHGAAQRRLLRVATCLVTFQALNPTVPKLRSSVGVTCEPLTFFVIR